MKKIVAWGWLPPQAYLWHHLWLYLSFLASCCCSNYQESRFYISLIPRVGLQELKWKRWTPLSVQKTAYSFLTRYITFTASHWNLHFLTQIWDIMENILDWLKWGPWSADMAHEIVTHAYQWLDGATQEHKSVLSAKFSQYFRFEIHRALIMLLKSWWTSQFILRKNCATCLAQNYVWPLVCCSCLQGRLDQFFLWSNKVWPLQTVRLHLNWFSSGFIAPVQDLNSN